MVCNTIYHINDVTINLKHVNMGQVCVCISHDLTSSMKTFMWQTTIIFLACNLCNLKFAAIPVTDFCCFMFICRPWLPDGAGHIKLWIRQDVFGIKICKFLNYLMSNENCPIWQVNNNLICPSPVLNELFLLMDKRCLYLYSSVS